MEEASDIRRAMERETNLLALAESLSFLIVLAQGETVVYTSPAAEALLGYPKGYFVGRRFWEPFHPDYRDIMRGRGLARLAGQELGHRYEAKMLRADGTELWVDFSVDVIELGGKPTILAAGHDVTEKKRAEEALRRSEERFRRLYEDSPVMMCAVDTEGRIQDISNYWLEKLGYEREEIVGLHIEEGCQCYRLDESRDSPSSGSPDPEPAGGLSNVLHGMRKKDGETLDVLLTRVPEQEEVCGSRRALYVAVDVTELRHAEEALQASEARYRELVEHAPEAIVVLDADSGRFIEANRHAVSLFGVERNELLAATPFDLSPPTQPNGRPSVEVGQEHIGRAVQGKSSAFEWVHVNAAGEEIACEIRLVRLPAVGRNLLRGTIVDVTEARQVQAQVQHQEKMAAVGMLAAGVAHEIGNPLLAVSMAAQSLRRKLDDPYATRKLDLIAEHVDRISKIVRQMSDLARPPGEERGRCDLNALIESAMEIVRYDKRAEGVEIKLDLAELPPIWGVPDQLTQVCLNLALNALDALASNPADRPRRLTVQSQAIRGGPSPGIRIVFEDTGPGIPRKDLPRLFQPFFTTKEVGRGTGMGLAVTYRIVQEHDGCIRVDGRPGLGARFTVELPVKEQP